MIVTMKTQIGGYRNGEAWPPAGGTVDVPDHEAADLIANGYAEEANDAPDAAHDDPVPADDHEPAAADDHEPADPADQDIADPAVTEVVDPAEPVKRTRTRKA